MSSVRHAKRVQRGSRGKLDRRSQQTEFVAPQWPDDTRWSIAQTPPRSSARLLANAVQVMPFVDDGRVLNAVEELALAVVDRDEELKAARAVISAALESLHLTERENARLRKRIIESRQVRA